MTHELVSTIVLNWNNNEVIFDCIDSLLAQSYPLHEIIVVDNGSSDGSTEIIENRYGGKLTLIKNKQNLGFAEGVNIGIRQAGGEFIAILNSDATADQKWIEEMVRGISASDDIGLCSCKIYLAGRDNILDNTGQLLYRDGLNRPRGRLEKDEGQYDISSDVLCPSGCAAMFRKLMLDNIGCFDKLFFAYGEDLELGLRARMCGYQCIYVSTAHATHRLSSSSAILSDLKTYYVERNRIWVALKCFPIKHLLCMPYFTFLRYFYLISGMISNKGPAAKYIKNASALKLLWILIKAHLSTLRHLPYLMRQRFALSKKTKMSSKEFDSLLKKHGLSAQAVALAEVY